MKTFVSWTLLGAGAFGLGFVSTSSVEAWGLQCPLSGTDGLGRYAFQFDGVWVGDADVTATD
jgi:hypothetical protein